MSSASPRPDERRFGARRVPIDVTVSGRVPATPVLARMLDISTDGCSIESPEMARAALGATIILSPPGLRQLRGQIMWVAGHRLGVCFDQAIAPQTIRDLQQLSTVSQAHR